MLELKYFRYSFLLLLLSCLLLLIVRVLQDTYNLSAAWIFLPLGIGTIGVIGITWISPYIGSSDASYLFISSPKETVRFFKLLIWAVPSSVAVSAPCILICEAVFPSDLTTTQIVSISLVYSILAITSCVISYYLSKPIASNVRALAITRQLCFECGYDLRCNPDTSACPECGAEVPHMVSEQER